MEVTLPTENNLYTHPSSIFVTPNNDVYVSGEGFNSNSFFAVHRKNDVMKQVASDGLSANALCITVFANDIYMGGYEWNGSGIPIIWKNGVSSKLSSSPGNVTSIYVK